MSAGPNSASSLNGAYIPYRISLLLWPAGAIGRRKRGVEAPACPSSLAPPTCGLPDVPCAFRMLCRRPPPHYERVLDSQASLSYPRRLAQTGRLWSLSARGHALWRAGSARDGGRYWAGVRSRVWRAERTQVDTFFFHMACKWRVPELLTASSRAHASRVLFLSDQAPQELPFSSAARVRM